jgi:mRNA interferase RelE/StbE
LPRTFKLKVPDRVASLVRGLHPVLKARVKKSLGMILVNPQVGKALRDELHGLRSFRVGRFRIVYRVAETERRIDIVAVGPRKSIYAETYRLLKKEDRGGGKK